MWYIYIIIGDLSNAVEYLSLYPCVSSEDEGSYWYYLKSYSQHAVIEIMEIGNFIDCFTY